MTAPRHYWQSRPSSDRLGNAEVWALVPSHPGYQASSWGRIMGPRGHVKSPQTDRDGYETYGVYCGTRNRTKKGHRMVCEAFHGPAPEDRPFVAHKDGNPANNRPSNLMWATARENYHHMRIHGTEVCGEQHYWTKLSREQVKEVWLSDESSNLIARRLGVSKGAVTNIRRGRSWSEYTKTLPPQPFRARKVKIIPPPDVGQLFEQGLTLDEVARRCGVSQTTACRWRGGRMAA